jgi:hypothetical protein
MRVEEAPVDGQRLLRSLAKGAKTAEAAKKLLNQVAAAIQLQPQETAKALLRNTKTSGGTNAGLRHIVNLIRQHGAPVTGTGLDILVSGWVVCGALAKSAIVLGTLHTPHAHGRHAILYSAGTSCDVDSFTLHSPTNAGNADRVTRRHNALAESGFGLGALVSSKVRLRRLRSKANVGYREDPIEELHDDAKGDHAQASKLSIASKVAHFGTRLIRKIPATKRRRHNLKVSVPSEENEEDDNCLWQMLTPGEVLRSLRGGARTLDGEDFKQLLHAAWTLFDECDAVSWMIEPKTRSDARAAGTQGLLAVQEALAGIVTVDSRPGQLALDAEPIHQRLTSSHTVIHQLKEICDMADDRLLRRAALYGLPMLLERVRSWVHASVQLIVDPTIAKPSQAAAHEMDSLVAKILQCFKPFEIAVEDGLGYLSHLPCETFLDSEGSPTAGAAVVCEEAWKSFLHSREKDEHFKLDTRTEEHEHDFAERFCTHKPLGFSLRDACI